MNETDLPYTTDSINNKKENDYIHARIKVQKRLWSIFKGTVNIEGFNLSDSLNDAITIWLTKKNKHIKCKCSICDCNININNYYYHFKKDKIVYYCSLKCLKSDDNKY